MISFTSTFSFDFDMWSSGNAYKLQKLEPNLHKFSWVNILIRNFLTFSLFIVLTFQKEASVALELC